MLGRMIAVAPFLGEVLVCPLPMPWRRTADCPALCILMLGTSTRPGGNGDGSDACSCPEGLSSCAVNGQCLNQLLRRCQEDMHLTQVSGLSPESLLQLCPVCGHGTIYIHRAASQQGQQDLAAESTIMPNGVKMTLHACFSKELRKPRGMHLYVQQSKLALITQAL